MRRTAEWLLLPLFLMPFGVALGLHLWAGRAYEGELSRYGSGGASLVRAWLAPDGPGHSLLRSFDERQARALDRTGSGHRTILLGAHRADTPRTLEQSYGGFRVVMGSREGRVLTRLPREFFQVSRQWRLAESFPAGLDSDAVADPQVRLAFETGRRTSVGTGLDAPSRAFVELLDSPEIRRLAGEPLPVATKLYLVRRWRRQGVTLPLLAVVEEALPWLANVERLLIGHPEPFPAGVHVAQGVMVLAQPPREPVFTRPYPGAPQSWPNLASYKANDGADGLVTLSYMGAGAAAVGPATLWQGRLETPLAGHWSFTRRFGAHWWSAPLYRRWIGPVAALLLAFLLLPTALLVSMRRRRRLDEARSRFINEMAHDLRTPLTSLRLYAEMLGRKPSGDAERDRYADVLTRESTRVTALLGNLLDLSRLEDGRRHLEVGNVDLGKVVAEAASAFAILFPARAANLSLNGPEATFGRADPSALSRCLANLLENAGKYTQVGTPIRISWGQGGDEVWICVADEGPGIPPAERQVAFERYARGARARRDGLPGTGLGLALVKELLTEMQGSVRLVSSQKGTEIEMRLPGGTQ